MKHIKQLFLFAHLLIFLPPVAANEKNTFSIALMLNTEREARSYTKFVEEFEQQNPQLTINLKYYNDLVYKTNIESWLRNAEYDLIYWQAGFSRLNEFVERGLLADLTSIWVDENLAENYTFNLKPLVSFQDRIVAIPFSYYQWGLFYNKRLFSELDIPIPKTLNEFMDACTLLDENKVFPLGIGLKEPWPILAWFTYITLRTHGLAFYNQLVKGQISWQDKRVVDVMQHWQKLLGFCRTTSDPKVYDWRLPSKSLLRNQVGFVLSGNYITQLYDAHLYEDIGFFRFPDISDNVPAAEIAPVEVWIVPARSKNQDISKQFIRLFVNATSLTTFNKNINYISPHKLSPAPEDPILRDGLTLLQNAAGLTPYFDRDAPPEMVELAQEAFIKFLTYRDIDSTLKSLESLRLLIYGSLPANE